MFASGTEKGRWREVDPELEPQDTGCISHVDTEAIRFSHFGDLLLCLPGRSSPKLGHSSWITPFYYSGCGINITLSQGSLPVSLFVAPSNIHLLSKHLTDFIHVLIWHTFLSI